MKATLRYASGWIMSFPKYSRGPMLFLEWMENNQHKQSSPFSFKTKSVPCVDEVLEDSFEIKWNASKETAHDCFDYIKNNL